MRRLGSGGMGAVYEAENRLTGRRVAIKLLIGEGPDALATRRLLREARAAALLRHENIVDVLDVGEGDDGTPFLVQELLLGQTLRDLLDERGTLPPAEARALLLPVLRALGFAHARGVVHRDVKPENIFLARTSSGALAPKVIDFGVARPLDEDPERSRLTRTGALLGTPLYMAPEQARGDDDIDARADVWSAGVVLYEMLAGRTPFEEKNTNRVLAAVLMKPVPRIERAAPGLPSPLVDVVHVALTREREGRYASMEDFARALEACPLADVVATPPAAPPPARTSPMPPTRTAADDAPVETDPGSTMDDAPAPRPLAPVAPDAPKSPSMDAPVPAPPRRAARGWALAIAAILVGGASVLLLRVRPARTTPPARDSVVSERPAAPAPAPHETPANGTPPVTPPVTPAPVAPTVRRSPPPRAPARALAPVHRDASEVTRAPVADSGASTVRPRAVVNAAPVVGL